MQKLTFQKSSSHLLRFVILLYWSLFWLFNVLDKIIGGSTFLWVGRDRFAQFQKFFASASVPSEMITNMALIFAAILEILALVYFVGALVAFTKKNFVKAKSWFFVGIVFTLLTFTFFAIGDHIFGDRFELLEHTLFWFLTIFTWVIYNRLPEIKEAATVPENKKTNWLALGLIACIALVVNFSIFTHSDTHFHERTAAIEGEYIGANTYKFAFPFLGGSTAFEKSIAQFKMEHPQKEINHIYTAPSPLRLKKADGLIFYVITTDKP